MPQIEASKLKTQQVICLVLRSAVVSDNFPVTTTPEIVIFSVLYEWHLKKTF